MHRILLVEDSDDIHLLIRELFKKDCEVTGAFTLAEGRKALENTRFDVVLLDITLPDGEGFKLCSWIRESDELKDLPVIFLTGHAEVDDKVLAFSLGAEDYVVKPFDHREFKARVLAKLERLKRRNEQEVIITLGNWRLNVSTQRFAVLDGAQEIHLDLTPLEFKLLVLMAKSEDRIFTRDQLISAIWGENVHVLERTVDAHVSNVRKKLPSCSSHVLKAVHGSGYKCSARSAKSKAA